MTSQKTYDGACDWIILLDSDTATATERAEFVRWLNQEPENAIAFEEMSQLWAKIGTLGSLAPEPEELFPIAPSQLGPTPRSPHFTRWVVAAVCSIVLMCGSIIWGNPAADSVFKQQFVTAHNQEHKLIAPDGSVIQMGLLSAIELNFSPSTREVRMHRGVIQFNVARDEQKPFVVLLGEVRVQALGTRFRITGDATRLEIQVAEGSVRFTADNVILNTSRSSHASQQPTALVLSAGQSLSYSSESGTLQLNTFQANSLTY